MVIITTITILFSRKFLTRLLLIYHTYPYILAAVLSFSPFPSRSYPIPFHVPFPFFSVNGHSNSGGRNRCDGGGSGGAAGGEGTKCDGGGGSGITGRSGDNSRVVVVVVAAEVVVMIVVVYQV